MKKLRLSIRSFLNFLHLSSSIELRMTGYLVDKGWYKSYRSKKSIDKENKSIPWLTYPFVHFLNKRLQKNFDMFEYGSGNSTFWYAERLKSVDAVEHHYQWFQYVDSQKPNNVQLNYVPLDYNGKYCRTVHLSQKPYDIIIVDGRDRNNCMTEAVKALKPEGVIILDNSERTEYQKGIIHLKEQGFKHLEFEGMSPVTTGSTTTSLFYKSNNCLGI
ncbi:MAG: FkbM family methyltransferase [Chitinophagaceae bacterium]|nr:FkbM family methyltransferase [Chitinophagaceae bacterium]